MMMEKKHTKRRKTKRHVKGNLCRTKKGRFTKCR
jgi:hypothetical protein